MSTDNSKPIQPLRMTMQPGEYFYCTCKKATDGVFCDGHKDCKPEVVTFEEETFVPWCTCGESQKGYRCDGSHNALNK